MPRNKIFNDKKQIIDVALSIIEKEGLESVSMRRLSKEMGVSSMTLYNYVRNTDDILREILILSFNKLYEMLYSLMSDMAKEGHLGLKAYAKAYAMSLYDFSVKDREICAYLIGDGKIRFHADAELRPFYNPFANFFLGTGNSEDVRTMRLICKVYECAILTLIQEHTAGIHSLDRTEMEEMVDLYINRMLSDL